MEKYLKGDHYELTKEELKDVLGLPFVINIYSKSYYNGLEVIIK